MNNVISPRTNRYLKLCNLDVNFSNKLLRKQGCIIKMTFNLKRFIYNLCFHISSCPSLYNHATMQFIHSFHCKLNNSVLYFWNFGHSFSCSEHSLIAIYSALFRDFTDCDRASLAAFTDNLLCALNHSRNESIFMKTKAPCCFLLQHL